MNKRDIAWETLFNGLSVLQKIEEDGFFDITAAKLKEITGEEPRLLAKWDSRQKTPQIFLDKKLGMLPLSTEKYRIADFQLFHNLEQDRTGIRHFSPPGWAQTLTPFWFSRSENILLSACYAAGIFDDFFNLPTGTTCFPTISGRLRAKDLKFDVETHLSGKKNRVELSNPQFEIDAGFESEQCIFFVEAKNTFCEDFNIRQLYIPWRYLTGLVSGKPIHPLFLMSHNGVITLYHYKFEDPVNFNSLSLIKKQRYSLCEFRITMEDIQLIAKKSRKKNRNEYSAGVVFPQADKFDLIIKLGELLVSETKDTSDVAEYYEYDHRQGQYYVQASRFLGLIRKTEDKYALTTLGQKIFTSDLNTRIRGLIEVVFQSNVFKRTFMHTLKHNGLEPSKELISQWILDDGWDLNLTTRLRRASTVLAWNRWIFLQKTD